MIKKIFTFLIALMATVSMAFAQQKTVVDQGRFFDNFSVGVHGGVNTPLNDPFAGISEQAGLQVTKYFTPYFGVAVDWTEYIDYNYSVSPKTSFDVTHLQVLGKFNIVNMFNYNGTRKTFEPVVFVGTGWGHQNSSKVTPRNYSLFTAGAEFNVNFGSEKQWTVQLVPEVVWDTPTAARLSKNNANLEINLGVVYHFKNHDGNANRTFSVVRTYDQGEVDFLNAKINELHRTVGAIAEELDQCRRAQLPVQTVETTKTVMVFPQTQFEVNSSELLPTVESNVKQLAEYIKANPSKSYTLTGYASTEGTAEHNKQLSEDRAVTLRDKLVSYGVDATQLSVIGAGATDQFSTDLEPNRVVVVEEK